MSALIFKRLFLCAIAHSLFAQEGDLNTRVALLESQMSEVATTTAHGNIGAKTASAYPQYVGENWFFVGDMLWWHADEGGTDYAVLYDGFPETTKAHGKNRKLNFKWDFGFKAGIGTLLDQDKWDLALYFTWFRTTNSSASSLHDGKLLVPLLGAEYPELTSEVTFAASQVKSRWTIHFYTWDLNLGRHFFVSKRLAFHPYVGVKVALIDQHVRTRSELFLPYSTNLSTKIKNDFWGFGPMLGGEGKWFLGTHFNVFGSAAASILWGEFFIRQHQHLTKSLLDSLELSIHEVVPAAQFQLGIGYETNIHRDRYHIAANVRYEEQIWWNQNQMPYFPVGTFKYKRFSEDLTLQGITVDVRFDF